MQLLYAYRNRDISRVRLSLESLRLQTYENFEVIFVDYGSQDNYSKAVEIIVNEFEFAKYWYVGHPGLLWNKSKALNFGIKKAHSEFIIIADVDVLFTEHFLETAVKLSQSNSFSLFKIGYLSKEVTEQQQQHLNLNHIQTTHIGDTFGIGLFPKFALEAIGGLDEFFHFYGSEDEDLNSRILMSGTLRNNCDDLLLYHQWHERYPQKRKESLQIQPRLTNVLRLNQRHFLWNESQQMLHPNPKTWGNCFTKSDLKTLEQPDVVIQLDNILAHLEHCFGEDLKKHPKKVVQVIISEAAYYNTLKYKIKQSLGKQTQLYMSMKAVNDLILKNILFQYRDRNYNYSISDDLKQIRFTIDFKTATHGKI
ncbi:glycosyltransferase [Gelidibacter salicanalis]|uniref:Glycosyltransferase n=1 Tax=Gelidibacter salicanalis TaxID=291193 RepID=A0A5C7AAR3_9FLAO|nr:glycosyltransferase [Gelidibacter salicanalis]